MKTLINLWNWFNGKKTTIGAAILMVVLAINAFDSQVVVAIWNMPLPAWLPKVIATLSWTGNILTGVGLAHKVAKSVQ